MNCQHREWHTSDDLFPQAICINCGSSKIINPFQETFTSHSQSTIHNGYWSEDFQFIAEDCTWMSLEEYKKRFDD